MVSCSGDPGGGVGWNCHRIDQWLTCDAIENKPADRNPGYLVDYDGDGIWADEECKFLRFSRRVSVYRASAYFRGKDIRMVCGSHLSGAGSNAGQNTDWTPHLYYGRQS
jgi:hypothetical protein